MSTRWQFLRERLINFYPPFLGAGIHAERVDDYTYRVRMKLTRLNRNLVGTHFGGSLYAMCDPWFMIILMRLLGRDYIVWDKSANIRFVRPGRGTVTATFSITRAQVEEICAQADRSEKSEPTLGVDVLDEQNQVVAHVDKLLYVRKKKTKPE